MDGPWGRSGQVRKISHTSGLNPRTLQPVAIYYTDWAIPTHFIVIVIIILITIIWIKEWFYRWLSISVSKITNEDAHWKSILVWINQFLWHWYWITSTHTLLNCVLCGFVLSVYRLLQMLLLAMYWIQSSGTWKIYWIHFVQYISNVAVFHLFVVY